MSASKTDDEHLFEPKRVPASERSIGALRLLHELGSGGMATLYLGTDEGGRLVAIKRMHRHLANEKRFVDMFHDEANIAGRIAHPNVAAVFGVEQQDGEQLIVMEYVHGESLAALCKACRKTDQQIPIAAALHLAGQACLGLDAAHDLTDDDGNPLDVVHRDVSPHNLIVSYDGELKIVDFGIAAAARKLHHTETGTIKGTFSYMSPEQTRGSDVDRRSDIFSLGAALYEAACGAPAFEMTNMADTVRRVGACEYRPPRELRPDIPPEVEAIIVRAMSLDPERRYPSAALMYRDIYQQLHAIGGMTTAAVGELMRRVFARRFAVREELRALAFAAPDVLEEEELTLDTGDYGSGIRCEYCGELAPSDGALEVHHEVCGQRRWWLHNFGGHGAIEAAGDAAVLRARMKRQDEESKDKGGLWQRIKDKLSRDTRDPLVVRLETITKRVDRVRDPRASEGARRAMNALWAIIGEIDAKRGPAAHLLDRLKPALVRCANALMTLVLEIESNANYVGGTTPLEIDGQIDLLRRRAGAATDSQVRRTIQRNIERKEQLKREHQRLSRLAELLLLRLDSMGDAMELCYGKVLQLVSSPAWGDDPATTQVTVFVDTLLIEVEELGSSVRDLEATLKS
ncbi:MAG: serine/threonine protein kinase [Myxococcales bacterium]|nr:serine/threonine protein kinase [Myxococcales bacterium]